MSSRDRRWQDLPIGGVIIQPGNSIDYLTGGWRTFRPVVNWRKTSTRKGCTKCLICWIFCPESAMLVREGVFVGVDLDHCKGCGLCATVCPGQCITMVEESQADSNGALREREGTR